MAPETHPDVKAKVDSKKWFYTDTVKEHFFSPKNFMLEEDEKGFGANGMGLVGSPACINPNTLIYTQDSLVQIKDIKNQHKVLSHDGQHHEVTKTYSPIYEGEVIHIKNQMGSVSLTPDHLVYAMQIPKRASFSHTKDKKKAPVSWVHAGDIQRGDITLFPIPKEVRNVLNISISQNKAKYDFKSKQLPKEIHLSADILRLFGYFIAEGNTREKGSEICFSFGGDELSLAQDVKSILYKVFNLDARINVKKENNKIEVTVNNVHLAKFLRASFGKNCYEKQIPDFLLYLETSKQKELLKGIWRGDGYISFGKKPRAEYSTTSKVLATQINYLLLRQKISSSLYYEPPKKIRGVNHNECFRVHIGEYDSLKNISKLLEVDFKYPQVSRISHHTWFDKDYFYMPVREVSKSIHSDGRLANLEVNLSHSYVSNAFTLHNCGDMMQVWVKINPKTEKITDFRWRTFGCASAIASTSMLSVMATENGGMTIDQALKIKPQDIVKRLGDLPQRKFHCSVLGDKALRAAINDYFKRTKQLSRVFTEGARMIDPQTKTTDKDIEEAVLEGADTLAKVQKRLKVGVSNKDCVPEVENLIRFYKEKYFS